MTRGAKMRKTLRHSMTFHANHGFAHVVVICGEPQKTWKWGLATDILQHNRSLVFHRILLRSFARPCLMCPAFSPITHKAPRTFSPTSTKPCCSARSVSSIKAASRPADSGTSSLAHPLTNIRPSSHRLLMKKEQA